MCGHISLVRTAFRLILGTQDVNFSAQPNFYSGFKVSHVFDVIRTLRHYFLVARYSGLQHNFQGIGLGLCTLLVKHNNLHSSLSKCGL